MAKRLNSKYANRSISWGTMRTEDLLEKFTSFLARMQQEENITLDRYANITLEYAYDIISKYPECFSYYANPDVSLPQSVIEDADELVHELFDALNDIAPKGCYFGAHPGDGSDYGFWKDGGEW